MFKLKTYAVKCELYISSIEGGSSLVASYNKRKGIKRCADVNSKTSLLK